MDPAQTLTAILAALALLTGGVIKGMTGIGLPLVAVPLLVQLIGLKAAAGLITVPIVLTNFTQTFQGGQFLPVLRRFWVLLVTFVVAIVASTHALVTLPERTLDLILGLALIILPLAMQFARGFRITPAHETWLNPAVGLVSGVLGGLSTMFGPPITLYMRALGMQKTEFVVAVSLLYFAGSMALFAGIYGSGVAVFSDIWLSVAALIPVFIGLWLGQRVHTRLSEERFSRILIGVLLAIGASFILRAL